jgi:DNA-binding transcriptional LysR family regulator
LESELGTKLMDRLGRRAELTASGEALLPYAVQILQLSDEVRRKMLDINHGAAGRLSIGASSTAAAYLLPPVLESYRRAFPQVKLTVATGPSPRVGEMVRSGGVDIGIVMDYHEEQGIGAVVLATYAIRIVVAPNHALAVERQVSSASLADALAETPLIVMQEGTTLRTCVEKMLADAGIGFRAYMELDNVEAIKKMIEAGVGLSILPEIAIEAETQAGKLVALPLSDLGIETQRIAATYRKDRYVSAAMRTFLSVIGGAGPPSPTINGV